MVENIISLLHESKLDSSRGDSSRGDSSCGDSSHNCGDSGHNDSQLYANRRGGISQGRSMDRTGPGETLETLREEFEASSGEIGSSSSGEIDSGHVDPREVRVYVT